MCTVFTMTKKVSNLLKKESKLQSVLGRELKLVVRWRLCIIAVTDCDKLLHFLKDEMIQDSEFFVKKIVDVVKKHKMRNVYFFK